MSDTSSGSMFNTKAPTYEEVKEKIVERKTRSKSVVVDLDKPTLEFTSRYVGPKTQELYKDQSIGFQQEATLKNPARAPLAVATNYHFWQEVADTNIQIVESDGLDKEQESKRDWKQDGPYKPPYGNETITNAQASIKFVDNPGFSTNQRMTSGYWLKSYTVEFRWKVARNTGAWRADLPCWTSGIVRHTVKSVFDPKNPGEPAAITVTVAGDMQWDIDLSEVGPGGVD